MLLWNPQDGVFLLKSFCGIDRMGFKVRYYSNYGYGFTAFTKRSNFENILIKI